MKTVLSLIAAAVLCISGCKEMPSALEGTARMTFTIIDRSGITTALQGDSLVRNAVVTMHSIAYGREVTAVSDANGTVHFEGLLSDRYSVIVTRTVSAQEMTIVNGSTIQRKLFGSLSALQTRADVQAPPMIVNVELSPLSDIVFSEIYACGPVGSGLYFHDKYMEVCNISESVQYLDGIVVARVYKGFLLDPLIYSTEVWKFPGSGTEYPIRPGQFVLVAEDAIDHRINAPGSVDESHADFEYYRATQPDVDNTAVPNMIEIYQTSGVDWLIGGEKDALVLCRVPNVNALKYVGEYLTVPKEYVIDGVEFNTDPTRLDLKILDPKIDAGLTGGILFYSGYSMERKLRRTGIGIGWTLEDNNNSSIDFEKITPPTPGRHHALP